MPNTNELEQIVLDAIETDNLDVFKKAQIEIMVHSIIVVCEKYLDGKVDEATLVATIIPLLSAPAMDASGLFTYDALKEAQTEMRAKYANGSN